MARFTVKRLRENVEEMNEGLAEAGSTVRFRISPRNNYQAVDEYEVDADGNTVNSCVNNVGCGTSREVDGYCWERYYKILNQLERETKDEKIARLEGEIRQLKLKVELLEGLKDKR